MSTVRAYNPGSAIDEKLAFDHPTNDPRVQNLISYWGFRAPAESFFDIPTEQIVDTINGPQTVAVRFVERVKREYKDYGVTIVDPKVKDPHPDDNVARDDKEAKQKGDRFWHEFLEFKAREHIENVDRAKAYNVPAKRAHGIYKHALNVLGLQDPADPVGNVIATSHNTADMVAMQNVVAQLQEQINRLTAKRPQ
jgi:hypothetical protein